MIDEKKLIESVKAYKELGLGKNLHSIAEVIIEIIEAQPKVGEWIPVEEDCDYYKFADWLLEEHKESIKLKQWEKDLLKVGYCDECGFDNFDELSAMLDLGHFKGITDTSMSIREILDNCEVVERYR